MSGSRHIQVAPKLTPAPKILTVRSQDRLLDSSVSAQEPVSAGWIQAALDLRRAESPTAAPRRSSSAASNMSTSSEHRAPGIEYEYDMDGRRVRKPPPRVVKASRESPPRQHSPSRSGHTLGNSTAPLAASASDGPQLDELDYIFSSSSGALQMQSDSKSNGSPVSRQRPAVVGFEQRSVRVTEACSRVQIQVTRSGRLDEEVRVGYRTINYRGGAHESQYEALDPELVFLPFQTSNYIDVAIRPDNDQPIRPLQKHNRLEQLLEARTRLARSGGLPFKPAFVDTETAERYLAELFQVADLNRDGLLQAEELAEMFSLCGFNLSAEQIAEVVAEADAGVALDRLLFCCLSLRWLSLCDSHCAASHCVFLTLLALTLCTFSCRWKWGD